MSLASAFSAAMLLIAPTVAIAQAGDVSAIVAAAQKRVESSDFRAGGRLVKVDATGARVSSNVTIEGHWFPGVLRVLVEVSPSTKSAPKQTTTGTQDAGQGTRTSILLEMRPKGANTIRLFRPSESQPAVIPVEKWGESLAGTDFSYEDFLQPEYYWQSQSLLPSAKFGTRDCDVLKSAPGARDHSHYAEVDTWLDHTIQYPVHVEKKPKSEGSAKEFTYLGLSQSGGVWAARQVEVKTQGQPGSTVLILERGSTRANLSEKDFSVEQINRFERHP